MKNTEIKIYYCKSPGLIFLYGIAIIIFAGCVTGIIAALGYIDEDEWEVWERCLVILGAFIGILLSVVLILHTALKKVKFDKNAISINKDIKIIGIVRRLQYAVKVEYKDIQGLSYMMSRKDSLGNEIDWIFVNMPYLVLHCGDNEKKAINLYYFSKKQKIKIINEVITRVKQEGGELNVSSAKELIQNYKVK